MRRHGLIAAWRNKARRFATSREHRRRVFARWQLAVKDQKVAIESSLRSVRGARDGFIRGFLLVFRLPAQVAFAAWAAVYLTLNWLSGGQIDWLLNTRRRWTDFSRHAAEVAPAADFYHGHDFSAIGAALRTRRRHRGGRVVYDSHEVYVEAGSIGKRSAALKALLRLFEGRAYRESDALITVNRLVAKELEFA